MGFGPEEALGIRSMVSDPQLPLMRIAPEDVIILPGAAARGTPD